MTSDRRLAAMKRAALLAKEGPLTVGDAATVLGLHPQKLRRLENAGKIPAARRSLVHGDRMYSPRALAILRALAREESR
jgi:predicted ArsR family transcriptional regulator